MESCTPEAVFFVVVAFSFLRFLQSATALLGTPSCPSPTPNAARLKLCHCRWGAGVLKHFPIYVCVPEEEVAAVIDSCPEEKREDLVFMASGCLEPLLKSRGLCRDWQTQATLYFSVDKVRAVILGGMDEMVLV